MFPLALDPRRLSPQCARAIRELARLGDHFFGVHVDPDTDFVLEQFAAALEEQRRSGATVVGQQDPDASAIAAAVPLAARATELQSVLGARARLEARGALVAQQLDAIDAKINSGMQSSRGIEVLQAQAQPLQGIAAGVRAALPRLEERYTRQYNATGCLLAPRLVAAVEQHEATYQPLAAAEAEALGAIATAVAELCSRTATAHPPAVRVGVPPPSIRHDAPAVPASGVLERSLPAAAESRDKMAHSYSIGAPQSAAEPPTSELATLLMLLSAARRAAGPLRTLAIRAFSHAAHKVAGAAGEKLAAAQANLAGSGKSGNNKRAAGRRASLSLMGGKGSAKKVVAATADGGANPREALQGPHVCELVRCCARAQEECEGDYTRLVDMLTVRIAFDTLGALREGLEWLCAPPTPTSDFEALHAQNDFDDEYDSELSAGERSVRVRGWLLRLPPSDGTPSGRFLVELRLTLKPLLRTKGAVRRARSGSRPGRASSDSLPSGFLVPAPSPPRRHPLCCPSRSAPLGVRTMCAPSQSPSQLPDAERILAQLDVTQNGPLLSNVSQGGLSKEVLARAAAGTVRRIQANRMPIDEQAGVWTRGQGIETLLGIPVRASTPPPPCALSADRVSLAARAACHYLTPRRHPAPPPHAPTPRPHPPPPSCCHGTPLPRLCESEPSPLPRLCLTLSR